jgi:hypothetical protein
MINSIPQAATFTALRNFILSVVPAGVEVVRAQVNRVSIPVGDFITMTPLMAIELSTPVDSVSGLTKTISRPTQYTIQIDCYGATASDNAIMLQSLMRDDYAFQAFGLGTSGYDIAPLFAGDARQMPLTTGEAQYLERWTFEIVLQLNTVFTTPQETATGLTVDTISVERAFP